MHKLKINTNNPKVEILTYRKNEINKQYNQVSCYWLLKLIQVIFQIAYIYRQNFFISFFSLLLHICISTFELFVFLSLCIRFRLFFSIFLSAVYQWVLNIFIFFFNLLFYNGYFIAAFAFIFLFFYILKKSTGFKSEFEN